MNINKLKRLFPNASPAFIKANLDAENTGPVAVVECGSKHEPLEKKEIQGPISSRILVRVTSIRKRLLDEDNLCEKFCIDLCRYAGIIYDDAPDKVKIQTQQRKVAKGEAEHTLIEIFEQ